ncbi:MAG: amidohydrolase family protein [Phycisphaerae bacterium]|nr:amidohydrolase family protein [Phycisphaerae bacterium]
MSASSSAEDTARRAVAPAHRYPWTGGRVAPVAPGGLSTAELLRVVTIDAARALGLGDRVGSIEPAKQADLTAFPCDIPSPPSSPTRRRPAPCGSAALLVLRASTQPAVDPCRSIACSRSSSSGWTASRPAHSASSKGAERAARQQSPGALSATRRRGCTRFARTDFRRRWFRRGRRRTPGNRRTGRPACRARTHARPVRGRAAPCP